MRWPRKVSRSVSTGLSSRKSSDRTVHRGKTARWSAPCLTEPELEASAARWIRAVTRAPPRAADERFGAWLASGVVLCALANAIRPGLVAAVDRSGAPRARRANLAAFARACRALGLGETDVGAFEAADAFAPPNAARVVRAVFALGIDRPEYLSVHSAAARLAPPGAALVHVARYLGAGPAPPDTEAGLERLLDAVQPGWRDAVIARRYVPALEASGALVTARAGGLAGRPGTAVPDAPGLFLAGDWVGGEGMLADASLASGRAAARAAVARSRAAAA